MGERVMKGCGARRRVGAAGTGVGTGRRERGVTCADPSAAGGAARLRGGTVRTRAVCVREVCAFTGEQNKVLFLGLA